MKNFFMKTGENALQQNKLKKIALFAITALLLVLVLGILFLTKRPPLPSYRADQISLSLEELMPKVTHAQARANICEKMSGNFYEQVCSPEFKDIPKDDSKKLIKLFSVIETIKNDSSISDYDRYFLAQLISASLPTKDSSTTKTTGVLETISQFFKKSIAIQRVFADEPKQQTEFRDFDEQMARDFTSIIYDLPKGDNSWVINVMVSKYAWVDGQRQPIYSEQFTQVFDPFPANSSVQPENISYHLRSAVNSKSYGINESQPASSEQTGVMVVYSFLMESWYSQGYGHDESAPEKQMETRKNFSEEEYDGTNHMDGLFAIMDEIEKTSPQVASRRNLALESRKSFNKENRKVQTRPREQSSKSSELDDSYFGTSGGFMPEACEAILAKMPTGKPTKDENGNIIPHEWREYLKNGKNFQILDLGTCNGNIIFEEKDDEDMQILVQGFSVMNERNEEYFKEDSEKYGNSGFSPKRVKEIYNERKKEETERNQSAKKQELVELEGTGFIAIRDSDSSSDPDAPSPYIDARAEIINGKCLVSYYGFSNQKNGGDYFFTEYIPGPRGRSLTKKYALTDGIFGKYHYREYEYDGQGNDISSKIINEHPAFDHGFNSLREKMTALAPQIVEAIEPFCE